MPTLPARFSVSIVKSNTLVLDDDGRKLFAQFIAQLKTDPNAPQLDLTRVDECEDGRVRTGRLDSEHRIILFRLATRTSLHFLIAGVYPTAEADEVARKLEVTVNPINGVTEIREAIDELDDEQAETSTSVPETKTEAADVTDAEAETEAPTESAVVEPEHVQEDDTDEEGEDAAEETPFAAVDETVSPYKVFLDRAYGPDRLYTKLGISRQATRTVMMQDDAAFIPLVLQQSPLWEVEALCALAAGQSIEEVADLLGIEIANIDVTGTTTDAPDDSSIIAGIRHEANSGEYITLDDPSTEEIEDVIESLSFEQWRIFLPRSQRTLVTADFNGSARVRGGAGTGKTVVALHRAHRLLTEGDRTPPRVLLTTFNRAMAGSLRTMMSTLDENYPQAESFGEPGMYIRGVDQIVNEVLHSATEEEISEATRTVLGSAMSDIPRGLSGDENNHYWEDVLASVDKTTTGATVPSREFFLTEYEMAILAEGVVTCDDYVAVHRSSRLRPLDDDQRRALWPYFDAYHRMCVNTGRMPFETLAAIAAAILRQSSDTPYDHVLVDEAQDFHAGHWLFLRACVPEGPNDIFLAEDSHQRIYRKRLVLSHFGIDTRGRSHQLLTNYRTTAENLGYATGFLKGVTWYGSAGDDDVDNYEGQSSLRNGPAPIVEPINNPTHAVDLTAQYIKDWHNIGADEGHQPEIAVLARHRSDVDWMIEGLIKEGIDVENQRRFSHRLGSVGTNEEQTNPLDCVVMTMHGAKGFEFSHVIVLGDEHQPLMVHGDEDSQDVETDSKVSVSDKLLRERALLYVATSRARDQLVVLTPSK